MTLLCLFSTAFQRTEDNYCSHWGNVGFVPNALLIFKSNYRTSDYHSDIRLKNYRCWKTVKVLLNLPPCSIVVGHNVSDHNVQTSKLTSSNSSKSVIKN